MCQALCKTYKFKGSHRFESVGNITRIRMGNIEDAAAIYTAIRSEHMDLAVEYISLVDFVQVSPLIPKPLILLKSVRLSHLVAQSRLCTRDRSHSLLATPLVR